MVTIRVGTRGSQLALTQTGHIIDALRDKHPSIAFERVIIRTTGDKRQNIPFAAVGTKGMFVKEIEEALLAGEIDFAVHSLKDMPGELPDGLTLSAVPRRADPRDALLSRGAPLGDLPAGALIGTSSLRRQIQIRKARPDVRVEELRGNLDTRVRKLDEGQYDAIVLACAGLERMGWADRITQRIPEDVSIPAPGQGALALETRAGDDATAAVLASLNDEDTADAVSAERSFQAALNAGCTVPAGAHARIEDGSLRILAFLADADGSRLVRVERSGPRTEAANIGRKAAEALLSARES
jgi:hydroxymethylbilane synthase